jgi:DNA gyrase/topoisomerase IV subunit B
MPKEKKGEVFQKLTRYIIEKKHIYIEANPLTKVLGLHMTKSFYIKRRNEKLKQEAESMPPQHFAPWQRKAWQNQRQQLKEAQNQPSLESRKLA